MALIRQVLENKHIGKWAYVERSDENDTVVTILGDKEFDTKQEAEEFKKGFDLGSYTWQGISKVKIPEVGRTVMYFKNDGIEQMYPAVVTDGGDLTPCLTVFHKYDGPQVKLSVQHKTHAPQGQPYWEWPEIK